MKKTVTSSIIGYLWKTLGLDFGLLEETIAKTFSEKLASINISAAQKGYDSGKVEEQLQSKGTARDFILSMEIRLLPSVL
jgi:Pyruvate/2-oxoacid:ferredoxin oxidoreductase gamma subunit